MNGYQVSQQFPNFTDVDGKPLEAGYVYIGQEGLNPETNPISVYWDEDLTIPAAQPLRTSGGYIVRNGNVAKVFTRNPYSLTVRNKKSKLVYYSANYDSPFPETGYNVKKYGAVGDGITDDTQAFKDALAAVCATGGALIIPTPGIYKITEEVAGTSNYAVSILSDMGDYSASGGSYIAVGAAIVGSIIKLSAAGGTIHGLCFADPTCDIPTGAQGTRTVSGACLELTSYSQGTVERNYFDFVKGGAIKAVNMKRSNINWNFIRACGDTGNPVINLASTSDGSLVVQATNISENKIEACYNAQYVYINRYSADIKLIGNQFEADTTIAATNQYFIHSDGRRIQALGNKYNRNTATSVFVDVNSSGYMSASNIYDSTPSGVPQFKAIQAFIDCTQDRFQGSSASTGTAIDTSVVGYANFTGCNVYFNGNVNLGPHSTWTGGELYNLKTTQPYAVLVGNYSSVTGAKVHDCAACGGIKVTGGYASAVGNVVKGNGGIGIRNESSTSVIKGNECYGNSGGDFSATVVSKGYMPEDNYINDSNVPLASRRVANGAGSTSSTSGVAANLFTIPNSPAGLYVVYVWVGGQGPNYAATAMLVQSSASGAAPALLVNQAGSASIALSLSGSTVRATQSSGSTATINYAYELLSTY